MAILLRLIIMAVGTGAVVTAVQELLDGTFKDLVFEIRDTEGVTEEDAKDIVGNILIDLAINSATVGAVLKTKVFVTVVEYFGLTSRGYVKKALTGKAATVAVKMEGAAGLALAKKVGARLLKVLAVPGALIWLTSAVANIIEPGIYKPEQTNALYRKLGIPFQYPTSAGAAAPAGFDGTEFRKIAEALETAGVTGIENPVEFRSELYTREGLANIINYVYGQEILKGNKATPSKILPLIKQYLIGGSNISYSGSASSVIQSGVSVAPITKVFTGIVSQGVVGQGLVFTARPDDLIESAEELRQAAANNLAPFLNTLLGKIVYEVKVVSSIITREGFKQSGTSQRIRTGTDSQGNPKYKTVTNKFATLVVYALTDKGSRAKLTTIVLGPTNSAKLIVGVDDLRSLEGELPSLVTTNDINDIKGLETAAPVTISTPPSAGGITNPAPNTVNSGQPAPEMNTSSPVTAVLGTGATTLFEWYQAWGLSMPLLNIRANVYEALGLGQRSYYGGTAEQNTKLLQALKALLAITPNEKRNPVLNAVSGRTDVSYLNNRTLSPDSGGSSGTTTKPKVDDKSSTPKDEGNNEPKPPKVGEPDVTGKIVKGWVRKSNGDLVITYKDGSTLVRRNFWKN